MPIDLGIDTKSEYKEELRVEDIGGGYVLVFRPPSTKQIAAVSLELVGKRRNDGAIRDMLDTIVLSVEEVRELAYTTPEDDSEPEVLDEQLAGLLDEHKVIDIAFLIERMKDPTYTFDSKQWNKLVTYLLEQRTDFPTKQSSGSSSGPTTTGRNSTASSRRVASTPSRSRRVGS